jgi:subtilase family serine protease
MARVGTANFKPSWGTENLHNQRESFWRQSINREYYSHPSNSLHIKVPQPTYHGLQSTSNDFFAKPWHVMSDASGQQVFPSAGTQTFYLGGGSTTTPIFPFEN